MTISFTGERLAQFFADAALERMALSIAYGVFLQAQDTMLSGLTEGRWFDYWTDNPSDPCTANLRAVVWRRPDTKVPMLNLEFFEFYELNRDVFVGKAKMLNTIVLSLGG